MRLPNPQYGSNHVQKVVGYMTTYLLNNFISGWWQILAIDENFPNPANKLT
jgi:hypothetical protein